MRTRLSVLAVVLVIVSAATGAAPRAQEVPPPAQQASPPATVIQDDAVFLHGTDAEIRTSVAQVRSLGIARIRVTAGWSVIAPQPNARLAPAGDLSDPAAYPPANWANLDRAVRLITEGGLAPMIDVAFWAPRWATRNNPRAIPRSPTGEPQLRTDIDPLQYARFAQAVARRYAGAVDLFTIWNEPNHPGFLAPQWKREGSRFVPHSPDIYRAMVRAAYPAIKAAAPHSRVLIGGTSSMGSSTPGRGGVPPLRFLRELACVDAKLRPITTGSCANFTPVPGDGWAHHPYSLRTTPDVVPHNPDLAPVANTPRLARLLARLVKMGRLAPANADIYMTEYGYETNPPDPRAPFTRRQQPSLLAWAESIAMRTPQVVMWPQFLLRDRPGYRAGPQMRPYGDWQTGLLDARGHPKPSFARFRTPTFARCVRDGGRRVVEIWSRVRGDADRATAVVEARPAGAPGAGWRTSVSMAGPQLRAPGAAVAVASAPGAAVRRYVPWRRGQQLRLRWIAAGSSQAITTVALDAPRCPA